MSNLKVNTINDASGGSAAVLYGVASPPNSMGFRNRLINSDMRIDQRNAGASVAVVSGLAFPVDRTQVVVNAASGTTAQRSTTAPAGFTNSLAVTIGTGASPTAAQQGRILQPIEGLNCSDLAWGTASAAPVTISFWVRSSVTGTYAGGLYGGGAYIFTYAIAAANTWEYKTVTIPGPTTGSWPTDNSASINVNFDLGTGSNYQGTAGSWTTGALWSTSSSVKLCATTGATFYITGVQLEAGTVATPFERRDYGRELMMCQRYFQLCSPSLDVVQPYTATTNFSGQYPFACEMRAVPTLVNTTLGSSNVNTVNADSFPGSQARSFRYRLNTSASAGLAVNAQSSVTASAEL